MNSRQVAGFQVPSALMLLLLLVAVSSIFISLVRFTQEDKRLDLEITRAQNQAQIALSTAEKLIVDTDSMPKIEQTLTPKDEVIDFTQSVWSASLDEYNKNSDRSVNLLQLWVFPNQKNVTPRYDQKSIKEFKKTNTLYPIITPNSEGATLWIHQDAWFHLGDFNQETTVSYPLNKEGNGVYVFIIEGAAEIEGQRLQKRDALGVWETNSISIIAKENTRILIIEVPMN